MRDRAAVFRRTLESLAQQSVQPVEMIVVDGSDGEETRLSEAQRWEASIALQE